MHKTPIIVALALSLLSATAYAQDDRFPVRPLRLVVTSAAGGGADAVGRILADAMEKRLGQQVIVENKTGAGGRIGAAMVANSPPDGYTFVLGTMTTHILAPGAMKKLPYDPIKNFTQLGQIGNSPILLVAANDYPANNLAELTELGKKGPLQYASWGIGSTGQFCMEIFAQTRGVKIEHIPYVGGAKMINDMIGGHIRLGQIDMATGTPFVQAKQVKALATCTRRSQSVPDVASYPEQGINFDQATNWTLHGPANLPPPIRKKLEDALAASLAEPEVKQKLELLGITVEHLTGPQLTQLMERAIPAWAEIAKKANITID